MFSFNNGVFSDAFLKPASNGDSSQGGLGTAVKAAQRLSISDQNRKKTYVVPTTIRSLLNAGPPVDGENNAVSIHNKNVGRILTVGQIMRKEKKSYKLRSRS